MINRIGGRKLLLGTLVIALGVAIDLTFGLSSNLLQLITFVTVGFFLGNAGEHFAHRNKKAARPEEDPIYVNLINSHNILNDKLNRVETEAKQINKTIESSGVYLENTQKALEKIAQRIAR